METATLTVQGSGPVTTFDADYDAVGNITQKLGVGGYTYHATKKHAVVQAGGTSYTYDGNGNQLTRGGITQTWTVANLPKTLAGNGYTADFKYGPSRARYEQVATYSGRTETTLTVGGFERLIRSDRVGAEVRYRVSAGGIPVAEVKDLTASNSRSISYLHRDHLGSVDTVTDESGAVVARMSFDVHGNRRAATGAGAAWQASLKYPTGTAAIDALRDKTPRGYTDHEMLDNVGLVHMNGRVYDPVIGRFLSVDPVFQFPENTQSLNPYTYVLNGPLSFTDPTGLACDAADSMEDCAGSLESGEATKITQTTTDENGKTTTKEVGTVSKDKDGTLHVTNATGQEARSAMRHFATDSDKAGALSERGGSGVIDRKGNLLAASPNPAKGLSGLKGTQFFGGAGMDGEYINDMVTALGDAGISNASAADAGAWSGGTIADAASVMYNNDNRDVDISGLKGGSTGSQFNLVGYSAGALTAAQIADEYTKGGGVVDNLVLIGAPISEGFLRELRSNPGIKNIRIHDLTAQGDPLYAGMSDREIAVFTPQLVWQMSQGTGHFYYAPATMEGALRRRELARELYAEGLR